VQQLPMTEPEHFFDVGLGCEVVREDDLWVSTWVLIDEMQDEAEEARKRPWDLGPLVVVRLGTTSRPARA
jgi:hypothetical protein